MNDKERLIKILKREIAAQTSPSGSLFCDKQGVPMAVNEISLLAAAEKNFDAIPYEAYQCYLCHDKRENPNCECCDVCPEVPR